MGNPICTVPYFLLNHIINLQGISQPVTPLLAALSDTVSHLTKHLRSQPSKSLAQHGLGHRRRTTAPGKTLTIPKNDEDDIYPDGRT